MLAGDEPALAVAGVAVGVVGRAAEDGEAAVLLAELHDPVVRDVADQHVAAVGEVHRPLGPAHAGRHLLDGAAVDAVAGEARIEDLHRRVGIALVRLELERLRAGHAAHRGQAGAGRGHQEVAPGILAVVLHGVSLVGGRRGRRSAASRSVPNAARTGAVDRPVPDSSARRLGVAQADVQLAQLLLVDRPGRVGEQVLRPLRLRERDHVAQRLGAGHQHDEAVEADRDAAVRRRAVLQRVEQEAELRARFLGVDLERAEHLALHVLAMDPHRAAAELDAVQDDVVGLGDAAAGIGLEPVLVAVLRARERMVHRAPALRGLVVLEHREVDHPERLPLALHQAARLAELAVADLDAQRAERVVDDRAPCRRRRRSGRRPAAPVRARISASAASCRFLTTGDCRPSRPLATSLTLIQARPLAP